MNDKINEFKLEVQIEDTQPLPDDEALRLLGEIMIDKTIRTSPNSTTGEIEAKVVKAEVIEGKIVVTAIVNDPSAIARLNKGNN